MRRYARAAVVIGSILMVESAVGAIAPPSHPFEAITWPAISRTPPAKFLTMGSLEVQFEKTTLGSIMASVGKGTVSHHGDAGESNYWLCYTVPGQRLWIMSHGEMGGGAVVTSIAAERGEDLREGEDCPSLPKEMLPITINGTISLGSSVNAAEGNLGPPSHVDGAWRSYDHEEKVPGDCDRDGFDRLNWLFLKVIDGHVTALHAGQVTSC